MSAAANVPDVPKVAAERAASPSPTLAAVRTASSCHDQRCITLMTRLAELWSGVNMVFAHDTEVALLAAAALANTEEDGSLETLDELDAFVATWKWTGGRRHDRAELAAVQALRPQVRRIWQADKDTAVEIVNAMLRAARAMPQLVKHGGWDYHLHATSPEQPLAERMAVEAAMAVVDVIRAGELDRLRTCAADDCDDLLVDLSKNRSRRFCESGCGNRANVAAYRARRRAATT
jgi:predicted RNA-binding Zn ribbon-like protein